MCTNIVIKMFLLVLIKLHVDTLIAQKLVEFNWDYRSFRPSESIAVATKYKERISILLYNK